MTDKKKIPASEEKTTKMPLPQVHSASEEKTIEYPLPFKEMERHLRERDAIKKSVTPSTENKDETKEEQ